MFRELMVRGINSDPALEVVAVATDPFEARDMILKYKPDVMTLDIEMPKMDGHRLLKLVREDETLGQVPLVLFSSLISEEMRIKGEQLGASGQIAKPEMNELVDFLDSVLFSI